MKRYIASIIAGLVLAASAFAGPQAILSDLKGKVEIKTLKNDWAPASEGMKVDLHATISTGFDSTATLNIEKTKVVVKPLTRLTIDKLIEQSAGSVASSLFLRVGSVQASVKSTVPGTPQDFKVQSPYSTASVRGTEFEFDGLHLKVVEGVVLLVPGRPVRDIQTSSEGAGEGSSGESGGQGSSGQAGESGGQGGNQEVLPSGDEGFEGAAPIGAADPNAAQSFGRGHEGGVNLDYKPTSSGSAPQTTRGAEGSSPTRPSTTSNGTTAASSSTTTSTASGVTITITPAQ
jgi:Uncharacterized protein conserved in bacteria